MNIADPARPDDGRRVPAAHSARRRRAVREIQPLGHQPGLDGVRALAVLAVCLYHGRFGWAGGGFLGVSLFFTLSGFLITSLLLRERAGTGRVDLGAFWRRRFRRLLPAALVTQAVILLMGWANIWDTSQLKALRGDVPAALFWVVNWHFVLGGRSYGAQFASPSPIEHFWSLSVEEQFYFVFPVVVAGALFAGRGRLRPFVVTLGVLAAGSAVICGIVGAHDVNRAYFGTDARLAELVLGALAACALVRGTRMPSVALSRLAVATGLIGLGVTVWLWHVALVTSSWLYPWGLLGGACCSVAVITAAMQPGPFRAVMSMRPLRFVGRISYGIYLLHWPIFLWLTPARVHLPQWPLFGVRMVVTTVAAMAMYRLVEEPIRRGRTLRGRVSIVALPVAFAALIAATLVVTSGLPSGPDLLAASTAKSLAAPVRERVLVVGDQLAASVGAGLEATAGKRFDVRVAAVPWCGVAPGGYVRLASGAVERDSDRCGQVLAHWQADEADQRPDVVLIMPGMRDVADHRFALSDPWVAPTDPTMGTFLKTQMAATAGALASGGAKVVWLTMPHVRNTVSAPPFTPPPPANAAAAQDAALSLLQAKQGVPAAGFSENEDARVDALNLIMGQVAAAATPAQPVDDFAGWLARQPGGELAPANRTDGVGLTSATAAEAGRWIDGRISHLRRSRTKATAAPETATQATLPAAPAVTPRRTVPAGRSAKVLVVGDSVAFGIGYGLHQWAAKSQPVTVADAAQFGCPIARNGFFKFLGQVDQFLATCDWATLFPNDLSDDNPDVVVLATGIWEVVDRILPGETKWRHIGDPVFDHYFESELLSAIDTLSATGATVVLLTYPHVVAGENQGFTNLPESDPARIDRLNALIRDAVSKRPGVTKLIDFQSWLASQPGGENDPAKRTDGIHFSDSYAPTIGAWLGPQVLAVARGTG